MIYIGAYCNTDNKLLEFDVNLLVLSLVYGWQGIIADILLTVCDMVLQNCKSTHKTV